MGLLGLLGLISGLFRLLEITVTFFQHDFQLVDVESRGSKRRERVIDASHTIWQSTLRFGSSLPVIFSLTFGVFQWKSGANPTFFPRMKNSKQCNSNQMLT